MSIWDDELINQANERNAGRVKAKEVKEGGYFRKETSYGFFERHISLPKGVKESAIKAEYDSGVLEISIPRPAGVNGVPQVKTIPVTKAAKPFKA